MEIVFHSASKRGFADHGWLKATHSFSFANYYDNEKIHFGKLRVLNDDIVAPARGFDLHPHQDMEIITIPLSGSLRHTDNLGHEEIISTGEVQVMSAGTGIFHSEYNASNVQPVNLFQLWIFTDEKGHKPRYDQKAFSEADRKNRWQLLVSPKGKGETLWIHQKAYISIIQSEEIDQIEYKVNQAGNGVYFMLIDGEAQIAEQELKKRDAVGVWNFNNNVPVFFKSPSQLLAIEVPMH